MPKLQPHAILDPEPLIIIVPFTELLAMGQSPDKFASMAIIRVVADAVEDAIPRVCWSHRPVVDDLIYEGFWRSSRSVHAQIETPFPFQEASLVLIAYPQLLEQTVIEDGAVEAMHVVEIIPRREIRVNVRHLTIKHACNISRLRKGPPKNYVLDQFGGMLRPSGIVGFTSVSNNSTRARTVQ